MTRTQLRKYDTGRSRKSRHRKKAGKLLLECGVSEYQVSLERDTDSDAGPAVLTVPARRARTTNGNTPTAQMLLWDHPVEVPVSTGPAGTAAPEPTDARAEESGAQVGTVPSGPTVPRSLGPRYRPDDQLTLLGVLKGCGIGLAMAAALLLIYVLIR